MMAVLNRARMAPTPHSVPNIQAIGTLLYTQYLYVFEGAGLVRTRREGRYKFHDLQTDALESLVDRWLSRPGKGKR